MVMVPSGVVMVTSTTGVEPVAWRGREGLSTSSQSAATRSSASARDRVVTGPAEDVVPIAVGREDDIVAVASARPFVRVAGKEEAVVAAVAGEVVPAGITPRRSLSLPPSRSSLPSSPSKRR